MKKVCRDFTVSTVVPDDVNLEDVEIIIDKASASYTLYGKSVDIPEKGVKVNPLELYEC